METPVKKTYVSRQVHYSFSMPLSLYDEETKKVVPQFKRDQNGGKIVMGGRFVPEMKVVAFTNISRSNKIGYYSEYTTEDPAEIKYIEENILPGGLVMTVDKYKQDKNPDLYKSEQEKKKIIADKDAAVAEKSAMEKQLAEMREKVDRLSRKQ